MPALKRQIDMTQGSIALQLIAFSVPLLMGDLLQQLYNTADSMIVGNFVSKQALASVGATANIVNVLIGLFTGISTGATVVISQRYGAKQREPLSRAVSTTIWLTLVLGAVFTLLGTLGTPAMLRLLNTPEDVFPVAKTYLTIYFLGVSGLVLYNMFSAILRAIGDSRRPLYVLAFSSLLNMILDLVFILLFRMGVAGAALATILSQFSSAAILFHMLHHTEDIDPLCLRRPAADRETLRRILDVGLPIGIQKSIIAFSNTIVVSYINRFESGAMAAWSIHLRLDIIINHTLQNMSVATTTFVAQNVGAKKTNRIKQGIHTAFIIAIVVSLCYTVFFILFQEPLIRMFNRDADVLHYGGIIISTLTPLQLINAVTQIQAGALRGQGDSKGPMLIFLFGNVVFRQLYLNIGWRYTQTFLFVILCYPVTWAVCAVSILIYVRVFSVKWNLCKRAQKS